MVWRPLDRESASTGVGHDEDPVPKVRGTKRGSRYARPLRIVPEGGQVSENVVHAGPSNKETWYVFHEDDAGSKYAKDSGELGPEPPLVGLALPFSRDGNWLAGETPGNKVDWLELGASDIADVSVARDVGPPLGEGGGAERVDLDLPAALPARPLEAEVDPADPGEKGPEGRLPPRVPQRLLQDAAARPISRRSGSFIPRSSGFRSFRRSW